MALSNMRFLKEKIRSPVVLVLVLGMALLPQLGIPAINFLLVFVGIPILAIIWLIDKIDIFMYGGSGKSYHLLRARAKKIRRKLVRMDRKANSQF
jgi:hypothetical protein